jgi:hypothetical protein
MALKFVCVCGWPFPAVPEFQFLSDQFATCDASKLQIEPDLALQMDVS